MQQWGLEPSAFAPNSHTAAALRGSVSLRWLGLGPSWNTQKYGARDCRNLSLWKSCRFS